MEATEHERRDWTIVVIILLIGFLCVILAGQWALRFSPSWNLNTNMGSNLDPNSGFLTQRSEGFIAPLDPSILTLPAWINVYLTPGASFQTRTPAPTAVNTLPAPSNTLPPATTTEEIIPSPTSILLFVLPPTNTPVKPTVVPSTNIPVTPSTVPPPSSSADLQITKTDGVTTYVMGGTLIYTIIVTNIGSADVTGAVITDNKPEQVATWTWVCTSQNGGATGCDEVINSGVDFNDTVSLPSRSSIVYTVTAKIGIDATSDLVNTASVFVPIGYSDSDPSNNIAMDTDTLFTTDPLPSQIGTIPDNDYYPLPAGGTLTLNIPTTVNGHIGWDLVYYEWINQGEVYLDWIRVEIGDGTNWYTVFNWGNEIADANTNMDFTLLPPPVFSPAPPPEELDQRHIPSGSLYNTSGIAIDLDGMAPSGTYPYIRITAPTGDTDGRLEIDAIVPLP